LSSKNFEPFVLLVLRAYRIILDPTRISEPCTSELFALCKLRAVAVLMGWVSKFYRMLCGEHECYLNRKR
jgi:hypothetical protein